MRKFFIFLMFFILNCEVYDKFYEKIQPISVNFSLDDKVLNSQYLHVYFKNLVNSNFCDSITLQKNFLKIKKNLYPGYYDIYFYGLQEKKKNAKEVKFFSLLKSVAINTEIKNINLNFNELIPNYSTDFTKDFIDITINMKDLNEIFALSSLSIKIGSNRTRSIQYEYDSQRECYNSRIILTPSDLGECYLNISYLVKGAIGEDNLEQNNIYISTTYFKGIFIGEIE